MEILNGDVGTVRGHDGLFMVAAGGVPPMADGEPDDVLTVVDHQRREMTCARADFTPHHAPTPLGFALLFGGLVVFAIACPLV